MTGSLILMVRPAPFRPHTSLLDATCTTGSSGLVYQVHKVTWYNTYNLFLLIWTAGIASVQLNDRHHLLQVLRVVHDRS